MAHSTFLQSLANIFKKSVALSPEPYLDFSRQCLKEVRTMTTPRDLKSSEVINYAQCRHLVDSLEEAVHKASLFSEHNRHHSGNSLPTEDGKESTREHFKILCMLAKKVKYFIQSCCNGHWLHAAVMLTNLSSRTASLVFDLKLFTVLLPPSNEPCRYSRYPFEIPDVFASRNVKGELVKMMAKSDDYKLANKLRALIQNGQASNDDLELAKFLLERLDRFEQSLPLITPGSLQLILRERDLTNLKHMVQIGRGGSGTIHKASWLGIDVAVKTFYGTDNPLFKKEVPILAGLSHPNIVSFLCHGKDMGECFIVMELMEQDLFSLLKERLRNDRTRSSPFSVFEELDVMLQIAEAMDYLHEMRVLHRDLKSANILVRCMKSTNAEGYEYVQVKVSDFGLSKTKEFSMTQSHMTPNMGTTKWMAPELMKYWNANDIRDNETAKNEELTENYPFKCDVYSFGMVCLEILTGDVPFPNMTANEVKIAVCAGERPQLPDRCHETLKALIEECWNPRASSRPCFGGICTELRYLKSLHMTRTGLPVLQSLQNPSFPVVSYEEIKKRESKVKTDSSGPFLDLSLGPSLSVVSTSANLSSPRPVFSLRQDSFSLALNPSLGDNSTTASPTPASESRGTTTGIRTFTIDELQSLTSNFAQSNFVGIGVFSVVYGGLLAGYGKVVVKRMMGAVTTLGFEFIQLRVVGCISLRHRHVVEMLGYGIDRNDLFLVSEYVSQGTLAQRLFKYLEMTPPKPLSWIWRLKIAVDVAQALAYIHGFGSFCFYFDLNSSNVLLDDDFNAKVSGFGFMKHIPRGTLPQGAGPSGYMTSEYNRGLCRTKAAHVYSFGVVLMELLTGRPAVNKKQELVTLFREARRAKLGSAALLDAMDPHLVLGLDFHSDESTTVKSILAMAELALDCTADNPKARPDMDQAVSVLRRLLL